MGAEVNSQLFGEAGNYSGAQSWRVYLRSLGSTSHKGLMDVVTRHGGDVLRFAGDALYCSWSLPVGAGAEGTLAIATLAACRCAIELNMRCSSYHIPEIDERLSM